MRRSLFMTVMMLGPFLPGKAYSTETLMIRTDVWCPFVCAAKGAQEGYMVEIARKAFEGSAGYKIDYDTLNWTRAIVDTREGKFTALAGASKQDAPDFVFPAIPQGQQKFCFFAWNQAASAASTPTARKAWEYKDVNSLKDVILGTVKDYTYGEPVDSYISDKANNKNIDRVQGDNTLKTNLTKLEKGRIDVLIEEVSVVANYLRSNRLLPDSIKNVGCIEEKDLFIAFSPKNPQSPALAKMLSDKVQEMRANKELDALLSRYGIKDWSK